MALEDCDFCGCIHANMHTQYFQQAVLSTLCNILTEGIPITPAAQTAVPLAAVTRDGPTQVTTSYQVSGFTGTDVSRISVENTTDATISFSLDGVTPFWIVLPFSSDTYSAYPGTFDVTNLQYKGSVVPGAGVVNINGVRIA